MDYPGTTEAVCHDIKEKLGTTPWTVRIRLRMMEKALAERLKRIRSEPSSLE